MRWLALPAIMNGTGMLAVIVVLEEFARLGGEGEEFREHAVLASSTRKGSPLMNRRPVRNAPRADRR